MSHTIHDTAVNDIEQTPAPTPPPSSSLEVDFSRTWAATHGNSTRKVRTIVMNGPLLSLLLPSSSPPLPTSRKLPPQFAATLPAPSPTEREGQQQQTDWDRQVESETLWMRAQPATSEFALNVSMARRVGPGGGVGGSFAGLDGFDDNGSGGTRDFLFGFAMGAFLGVIMLLWLWESAVPRRQKLGILAGVTFERTLSMVQTAAANRRSEEDEE